MYQHPHRRAEQYGQGASDGEGPQADGDRTLVRGSAGVIRLRGISDQLCELPVDRFRCGNSAPAKVLVDLLGGGTPPPQSDPLGLVAATLLVKPADLRQIRARTRAGERRRQTRQGEPELPACRLELLQDALTAGQNVSLHECAQLEVPEPQLLSQEDGLRVPGVQAGLRPLDAEERVDREEQRRQEGQDEDCYAHEQLSLEPG